MLSGGARKELVSEIMGVGGPRIALDAAQARLLGKLLRDPTALGDMWAGPGREVYPAKAEEGPNWETWRSWKDCGLQWDNAESDGFTSVMSTILNKAAVIGGGDEGLSVGKSREKGDPGSKTPSTRTRKLIGGSWQYAKPGESWSEFSQIGA